MGASLQWRFEQTGREQHFYGGFIEFGAGRGRGRGYMSYSDRVGPGVLVLHGSLGLEPWVMKYADHLADEGFTVLAPDLYDGRVASSADEGAALAATMDEGRSGRRLLDAATHLTDNWHPRLGAVGLGEGGGRAARLAREVTLDALVLVGAPAGADTHIPSLELAADDDEDADAAILDFLGYHLS